MTTTTKLAAWTIKGNASLDVEPVHGWVEVDSCVDVDVDGTAIPGWSVYMGEVGDEDMVDQFMDLDHDGNLGDGDPADAITACLAAKEQAAYDMADALDSARKDACQELLEALLDSGKAAKVLKALRAL